MTGGERIEKAGRSGRLHLLLHAADAGADGSRKLDQALRVGTDREGSGDTGFTLPLSRTILSLALGRENVVHVGLTDARAAARVSDALSLVISMGAFVSRGSFGFFLPRTGVASAGLQQSAGAGAGHCSARAAGRDRPTRASRDAIRNSKAGNPEACFAARL